ncbi:MAG: DNA-binding response regulator [Spirochaetaceae bacterium]|nr:DNA-binding response regulator [Spirochaetaceae bacterium]|tara:strand:+ start:382968 stop:383690 length:723 start_codon:yes stop_codon:yes gene_type:complete
MNRSDTTVLLVEDDRKITDLLTEYLSGFEMHVISTASPGQAKNILKSERVDIAILDVMLPEQDGFSFLRELRMYSDLPVLMLTARGDLTDRVVGLELGADDYMSKPFEPRELIARLRALLRRSQHKAPLVTDGVEPEQFVSGPLTLDTRSRTASLNEAEITLTGMEFDILHHLLANQGMVLSRDRLTEMIHGQEFEPFNRTIDILISRIRNKLQDSPENPRFIRTVRGAGYLFIPNQSKQ